MKIVLCIKMLKELFKPVIVEAQKEINKEYSEKGLTNEILEAQVELNTIRNTLNIHDESEEIFGGFVQ